MKVLVPVKRVIDHNLQARVKADGSGADLANLKMSMNRFDEIGVEEAIHRLKEVRQAEEVIAVSISSLRRWSLRFRRRFHATPEDAESGRATQAGIKVGLVQELVE